MDAGQRRGGPGLDTTPHGRAARWFPIVVTLVFDIGVSMLVFNVLSARDVPHVWAYLAASIGPLLSLAVMWWHSHRVGGMSFIVLGLTLLSAAVTLVGGTDDRLLILKDSLLTGLTGLAFMATATPLVPRPAMYYFGQRFGTDGSAEGMDAWERLYRRIPPFRRGMRIITLVWGAGYVVEALIRVAAVEMFDFVTAYNIGQVLPLAVTICLITWTFWYSMRMRRRGEKAGVFEETPAV